MIYSRVGSWILVLTLIGIGGCGEKKNAVFPVKGTIKIEGVDLTGMQVIFATTDKSGRSAGGPIEAGGAFTLTSYSAGDGAAPGKYRVGIALDESNADVSATASKEYQKVHNAYRDAGTSPHEVTVEANDKNNLTIVLDPKGPSAVSDPTKAGGI